MVPHIKTLVLTRYCQTVQTENCTIRFAYLKKSQYLCSINERIGSIHKTTQSMKKNLLLMLALLACISLYAQNGLTVLDNPTGDYLGATCISPNGRYVAGSTLYGTAAFIVDIETGESTVFDVMDEDYGDCINSISNDGTGAGYGDVAYTFTMNSEPTAYNGFSTLWGISADGAYLVGNYKKSNTELGAACWHDGTMTKLPEPTEDDLGFEFLGSYAKHVSADGSIICGNIVDKAALMPAVLWRLNNDGTYTLDAFSTVYSTQADKSNPYMVFSPTGMSASGEWVSLWLTTADGQGAIGRYNTKTRELQTYICDGSNGDFIADPLTAGIANDGTLVGTTSYSDARQGFIWEATKSEPELLTKRFPGCTEFIVYDTEGYHTPSDISAEGRYITGFAATESSYESYVLDTKAADEAYAASIASPDAAKNLTTRRYSIDGRQINSPAKGIAIEKCTNGSSRKVLRK